MSAFWLAVSGALTGAVGPGVSALYAVYGELITERAGRINLAGLYGQYHRRSQPHRHPRTGRHPDIGRGPVPARLAGGGLCRRTQPGGVEEVSGIHHDLRPGISDNLGYLGLLASWLAGHNPVVIVAACFLIAVFLVAGDVLQLTAGLPSAAGLVLIGLVLFFVLGLRRVERPAL